MSQLAADQIILKHAWLLNAIKYGSRFKENLRDKVRLHSRMTMITGGNIDCLNIYLEVIWLNTANKKGVASEM